MNNKKNGGQVYPVLETGSTGNLFQKDGMNMRQRYKMAALQGILSSPNWCGSEEQLVETCVNHADAMIAEDQKFEKNNKSDS